MGKTKTDVFIIIVSLWHYFNDKNNCCQLKLELYELMCTPTLSGLFQGFETRPK